MQKLKTLNSAGIGHIVAILAIAVIVVAGGAGYVVYKHQKANASGFTVIKSYDGYRYGISACRTYYSGYGGGYNVTVRFVRPAGAAAEYVVGSSPSSANYINWGGFSRAWYANGTVAATKVTAPNPTHTIVYALMRTHANNNYSNGSFSSGSGTVAINPYNITNC